MVLSKLAEVREDTSVVAVSRESALSAPTVSACPPLLLVALHIRSNNLNSCLLCLSPVLDHQSHVKAAVHSRPALS